MSGLPKVSFTLGSGGLDRPLPGFDHYSIMIAYDYGASITTAYSAIGNKTYTSIQDAENDGVVSTCAEATAATSTQTVTTAGTDGDVMTLTFTDWYGTVITLGSYTKVTGDNTVTLVATAIVAAINALTYKTGFSATVGAAGAFTITAPKSYGTYPNTKLTTNTMVGSTLAITNVAFASGTKSQLAMYHYQISEFFRANPLGVLYFSIKYDDSSQNIAAFNTQIQTDGLAVQNAFKGQGRRILFYNPFRTFATSTLTSCKALRTTLLAQYTPATIWYIGGFTGSLSSQANTRTLTADGCSAVIGQSGTGTGLDLSYTQQTVIGAGGLAIGTKSAANISQNIGEVGAFPLNNGVECESAYFFDRTNFDAISTSLGDQLHDYGYIFLRTYKGKTGVYFNSDPCAVSPSSDYAYMADNETIDKAIRQVYVSILPLLNGKNAVNADGTLADASVAAYNEKCRAALESMVRDTDLNDYKVFVNRTTVVSSTGVVLINIKLQPTAIARQISITIGFTAKI